jgi:energy-coupling factor transporter ATP-binding protein EcfA2
MVDPEGAQLIVRSVARTIGMGPERGAASGAWVQEDTDRTASSATLIIVEHRVEQWLGLVTRIVVLEPGGGVVADGPALEVLADQGPALFRTGVWVPRRFRPAPTARRVASGSERVVPGGERVLSGSDLALSGSDRVVSGSGGAVVLQARGLAVARGKRPPVLTDVDLDVRAGEALFLTGRNGAGKSTLALALGGLAMPAAGTLSAAPALAGGAGPNPIRWPARDLVTRIGTVFQEPQHQFVAGTVEAELGVGPRRVGVSTLETAARTAEMLTRLHLERLALANPFTLSGGEQRRLSVATALVTRPKILVLDEPTFGQDARTWSELVDLLRDLLDAGTALVCATHDRDLVDVFLAEGRARELRVADGGAHMADDVAAPVVTT